MKKIIILALLSITSTSIFSQNWQTNFERAKEKSAKENKNIIMVFSGSDWCAPCIKLEKNIFETDEFIAYANKHWILVKLDFPKKKANKLSNEQQEYNNSLAEVYNQEGYFPLVVVLNDQGDIIGKTGYKKLDPNKYIELLNSF